MLNEPDLRADDKDDAGKRPPPPPPPRDEDHGTEVRDIGDILKKSR